MKTLQNIQKTFRVFQILAKVALILTIVGASFCAVGALCCTVWSAGGRVFNLFGEPILIPSGGDARQMLATLLANLVYLSADAVLLGLAGQYFRLEQTEGTPFTLRGADFVCRLGIHCIWMPIAAIAIAAAIGACLGSKGGDLSNLPSLAIGIVLILASLIFRYGAELEARASAKKAAEATE